MKKTTQIQTNIIKAVDTHAHTGGWKSGRRLQSAVMESQGVERRWHKEAEMKDGDDSDGGKKGGEQ